MHRRSYRCQPLALGLLVISAPYAAPLGVCAAADASIPIEANAATAPAELTDTPARPALATRRILKTFDFDERGQGNYSSLPLDWRRHGGRGFPLYLEGKLDFQVGHPGSPSFRLDLDGGSLAYHYEGRDIAVRSGCDYLVTCAVKTSQLRNARAYVSAHFLDRKGNPLPVPEHRSNLASGQQVPSTQPAAEQWEQLSIHTPCNHPDACYLALALWLTQRTAWDDSPRPPRDVEYEDIRASAWFDTLAVYRMPRVSLSSAQPGGIFTEDQPIELLAEVTDPDGFHLTAEVTLHSADGAISQTKAVLPQPRSHQGGDRVDFGPLPIGLYRAQLTVSTESAVLVRRQVNLLRVGPRMGLPATTGKRFGIVLAGLDRAAQRDQQELLRELHPELVKLPVWRAQSTLRGQPIPPDVLDDYLRGIREVQANPIGIMHDDVNFASPTGDSHLVPMLAMFSEEPAAWKHLIAGVWSRYSGLVQVWQIGADQQSWIWTDTRVPYLLTKLRKEMSQLMTEPVLAVSTAASYAPSDEKVGDYQSLYLPAHVAPQSIADYIAGAGRQKRENLWATVEPLPASVYPRELRLADLARRLVETYAQDVAAVFMAAPWIIDPSVSAAGVLPQEDFLVLRTVADVLGGSDPVGAMILDDHVQCRVFDRLGSAVLCVWDDQAPPEGSPRTLMLGDNIRQVDIWGRELPVKPAGKGQTVLIGPSPTFLLNATPWLLEFRRHFRVQPTVVEAGFEKLQLQVSFRNPHRVRINGQLRLLLPKGWEIRPSRLNYSLAPGEVFEQQLQVQFPLNAPARIMPLVGEFTLDAERAYRLTIPAWFQFGLRGVQCETIASRNQDQVTVRLMMTNTGDRTLNFESFLVAPDRERMERIISQFHPGQTLVNAFTLSKADDLAGRHVRVGLKEIEGTRIWNQIVDVP